MQAANLPQAIVQMNNLMDPSASFTRSKLALPKPQVSDAELEDIVKLGNNSDIVKLRAEMDVVNKQITSLWDFTNGLRDRLNGHGLKH